MKTSFAVKVSEREREKRKKKLTTCLSKHARTNNVIRLQSSPLSMIMGKNNVAAAPISALIRLPLALHASASARACVCGSVCASEHMCVCVYTRAPDKSLKGLSVTVSACVIHYFKSAI